MRSVGTHTPTHTNTYRIAEKVNPSVEGVPHKITAMFSSHHARPKQRAANSPVVGGIRVLKLRGEEIEGLVGRHAAGATDSLLLMGVAVVVVG